MRIRYVFNVHARLVTEFEPLGAHEADAGTLYGAQAQITHELHTRFPTLCVAEGYLRFDLVAAIKVGA